MLTGTQRHTLVKMVVELLVRVDVVENTRQQHQVVVPEEPMTHCIPHGAEAHRCAILGFRFEAKSRVATNIACGVHFSGAVKYNTSSLQFASVKPTQKTVERSGNLTIAAVPG